MKQLVIDCPTKNNCKKYGDIYWMPREKYHYLCIDSVRESNSSKYIGLIEINPENEDDPNGAYFTTHDNHTFKYTEPGVIINSIKIRQGTLVSKMNIDDWVNYYKAKSKFEYIFDLNKNSYFRKGSVYYIKEYDAYYILLNTTDFIGLTDGYLIDENPKNTKQVRFNLNDTKSLLFKAQFIKNLSYNEYINLYFMYFCKHDCIPNIHVEDI